MRLETKPGDRQAIKDMHEKEGKAGTAYHAIGTPSDSGESSEEEGGDEASKRLLRVMKMSTVERARKMMMTRRRMR